MAKPPGSQPSPHARIKWFEGPSSPNPSACSMKRIVIVPGPWEHPSSPPLGSDYVRVATFADDVEAALVDVADCSHPQRPRAVRTERAGGEGNAVAILSPFGSCATEGQITLVEEIVQRVPEDRCLLGVFWAGELLEHRRGRHLEPPDEGA